VRALGKGEARASVRIWEKGLHIKKVQTSPCKLHQAFNMPGLLPGMSMPGLLQGSGPSGVSYMGKGSGRGSGGIILQPGVHAINVPAGMGAPIARTVNQVAKKCVMCLLRENVDKDRRTDQIILLVDGWCQICRTRNLSLAFISTESK
jgi:hypothetical protein